MMRSCEITPLSSRKYPVEFGLDSRHNLKTDLSWKITKVIGIQLFLSNFSHLIITYLEDYLRRLCLPCRAYCGYGSCLQVAFSSEPRSGGSMDPNGQGWGHWHRVQRHTQVGFSSWTGKNWITFSFRFIYSPLLNETHDCEKIDCSQSVLNAF